VAVALPAYLHLGDDQWFYFDEWDFLATRDLSVDSLLRPHNEHWSTVPIVLYRALYTAVGLNSYWPYQIFTIVAHLAAGALLRVVMRHAGVGPWAATLGASAFVLFGAGRSDIVWAFQTGFTGAVAMGLAHLVLADHDGPIGRRDAAGVAVGLLGLLFSGVAVTMTVAVGIAVLVRRGWRAAALHTAPPAAVYLLWYRRYGSDTTDVELSGNLDVAADFFSIAVRNVFAQLGHFDGVGYAIAAVLVVGLTLRLVRPRPGESRRRIGAPLGLLAGGAVFFGIAASGRAAVLGADLALADRYAHIGAALVLPAVVVAAQALGRRWPVVGAVALAVVVVGAPWNLFEARARGDARFATGVPDLVTAVAHSPALAAVPRTAEPVPELAVDRVTAGWLLDGARSGRIPEPPPPASRFQGVLEQANVAVRVVFERYDSGRTPTECTAVEGSVRLTLAEDAVVRFVGGDVRVGVELDGVRWVPIRVRADDGTFLRARAPVTIEVLPVPDAPAVADICVDG